MRITLGGGGTDLPLYYSEHTGYVLSMAINKYFYSIINPRDDDKVQIISSDFKTTELMFLTLVGDPDKPQLSGSALIAAMSQSAIVFCDLLILSPSR